MAEELEQIQEENIEPTQEQDIQGEQVDQTEQTTPQPPSKASQLYNSLIKEGYTKENLFGGEDNFIKIATTKEGASKLYESLKSEGYNDNNLFGGKSNFVNILAPQPPVQKQTPLYTAKGFVEQKQKEEQAQPLPIAPKKEVIKPIVKQIPSITQYNRKEDENGFVSALGTTTDYAKHLYNKLIEGVGSLGAGALELQGMTTSALINAAQQITGDKSFNSQEFQNHINNEIVPKLKEKIKEVGQGASTAVFGLPGSKISEEREKKFNDNFLASSVAGVAEFAPAMPLGIVGMLAAGTDMGLQSINNTDAGKKLPESVKSIFAVATGTATALLTQLKLDKIFGKQTEKVASKLAVETLNKLLNESTEPITADAFNAALQNSAKSLKDKVVSSGGKLLKAGAVGSMFGGLNEATNLLAEDIANRSTGKEIFEPTSWGKVRGRIIKSAASMGVGGIVLGGVHIPFIKAEDYIKNKVSEAKSIDEINNLKREVTQQVQGGDVSIDNANRVLNLIDQYTKIHSSIPVDVPNKEKIVDKIKQRDDLHQQANEVLSEAQNLDPAFQEQKIKEAQVLTNAADDIHNQIAGKPVYKIGEQEVDRNTFNNYLDSEAAKENKEDLYVENDDEMSTKLEKQGGKTTIDEESGLPFTTTKTTQYDTENITGIPSEIGGGQEPIQTQPIEGRGTQATSGGGVLQENVPSRQGEVGKEAQEVAFEDAKEGDTVLHNGEKVTIVSKGKSRKGADIIEVKQEPKTKEEIKKDALQNVFNRVASEYKNLKPTWSDIELNHPSEVRNEIEKLTALENSRTATYTIDAETWGKEVKKEAKAEAELPKQEKGVGEKVGEVIPSKGENPRGGTWEEVITDKDGVKTTRFKTTRINKSGEVTEAQDGTRAGLGGREMTWDDFLNEFKPNDIDLEDITNRGTPKSVTVHELREGANGINSMTITVDWGKSESGINEISRREIGFDRSKPKAELPVPSEKIQGEEVTPTVDETKIKLPKEAKEVYHYSNIEDLKDLENREGGTWFTENPFGYQMRKGAKSKISKVIEPDNLNLIKEKEVWGLGSGNWKEGVKKAKENGYDGVVQIVDGDKHYLIFDINKTKNKSEYATAREKVSGAVQPIPEVSKGQKAQAGVQPSAEPVSGRGTEATTSVLEQEGKHNKDNQPEFTTSSGRQKVNRVGDELVVTDAKTSKEVSRKTHNKAVREYIDNFDFTHGEEGESTTLSQDVNEMLTEVVENSNNPQQIAQIYAENDLPFTETAMTKDGMIAEYGLGSVSKDSYIRFGDRNKITRGMVSNFFAKKGETPMGIDAIAKDMSEHYFPEGDGTEITPQDIVDFMDTYDTRRKIEKEFAAKNPLLDLAKQKFKKLTGIELTKEVADKAFTQKIEKETQAEQNLLKQDYENAKQLEDEYWKQYEATNGFTKEVSLIEVDKGKEGITEERAKVEVPLAENPFEKVPKTQVARDKYFKSTFGENANKAEEIYNKYKDTNDFEAMQKEMQGEKVAEQPPVPPVVEETKAEMPSEEEKWTAIRKAKLEEIKEVKDMFEKQTSKSWTKIQQEALEDVAKEFPKKTLNDAIRTKVERLAAKYDAKEDYNPTAKDLAVIQEFKRQTESRIIAAKEELLSDNDVERFAAIAEMESYQNDLMNASKALFVQEAGRAFGFRQSESIKDENAGLQIRRMQLMKANGMEKLSDADNKFLEYQWEKEKELIKREQEIKEQALKDAFDNEVAKLQEEYEAKLKEKKVSATDKKASDKLRKFAEKVRNSKTLDSLGLGAPIEGEAKGISFNTKEALAKVIDKMADGMDKIEAITKVLKEYGLDKSKEFSDLVDKALIKIAKPDTEETLSKIKDLAEKTGEKNVTNEMVTKGFIKDYVNSFIGEVDKSNILNEATAKLKEVLPDLDKRTLRNAFLKEGEFKQPTKKSLNEALNQAKRDLLKIEKEQSKKEATEDELQKKKLEQEKEKAQKSIKDYQRKLDNGEFEKEEPTVLKKQDAELIQINKEKNQIKSEFDKKRKELEEKNKHWLQRAADFARSTYIAALIGSPKTLAKVAYMSVIRPASEITRKVVLGNLFKAIAPSYYEAALRGGESASLKSIEAGLGAYFRQMGEKKMQEKFQKSSNEFDQAAKKYYEAVNAKADEKTLSKLKQDMDNKRLAAMGNIVYQFIGGSSIKDAIQSLVNRANEVERQFGKTETESIKDGNALDKLNYILGFIGRSHSAAKTFSGRFSYAASFMAKLEGAARDGSISDPNRIIEIAHESYLDWERGKYQQDNWVTKKWNDVVRSIKEKTAGKGEWSKYDKALEAILKTDVAITRVPVNILHEAVTEYTLGALRAPIIAYKEYNKAKGKAAEEGYSKTIDSKEFKARVKEIISQMDAEQAAKIYRLFTKGGLGAGLYGLALATGLVQFGVFPHKGQKKKKEEEYLKEGELNPGQIMFGKDRLGETASKIIEHSPSLWTTFMGLGIAKIYADDVKEGKMSAQAAWDAAYTHMQIIESSIPQSKVVSPLEISKQTGKTFAGKLSDYGMLDNYIDSKGAFINQEKKKLEMTTSEVARLKDYKVEPPRLGVRSQNKIEVDAKHPKVGLSKDGKPYAYMNDFEWDKFNQYRKDYINNALKEIYDAADGGDIKLTQENLTDALTRITKQATTIAKNKLVEDGLLPEKNKEDEEDVNVESINSIIKDIYQEAKE